MLSFLWRTHIFQTRFCLLLDALMEAFSTIDYFPRSTIKTIKLNGVHFVNCSFSPIQTIKGTLASRSLIIFLGAKDMLRFILYALY